MIKRIVVEHIKEDDNLRFAVELVVGTEISTFNLPKELVDIEQAHQYVLNMISSGQVFTKTHYNVRARHGAEGGNSNSSDMKERREATAIETVLASKIEKFTVKKSIANGYYILPGGQKLRLKELRNHALKHRLEVVDTAGRMIVTEETVRRFLEQRP